MGQLEPLIVMALGRSPYDEVIYDAALPEEMDVRKTGRQEYNDRGHPVNEESRQRMRMHVRASNEVMQAAGIIEETAEVRAREEALKIALHADMDTCFKRLELGREVVRAGIWGVCGWRRRSLLYNNKAVSMLEHLWTLRHSRSLVHDIFAGLPSILLHQAIDRPGTTFDALTSGPYTPWTLASFGMMIIHYSFNVQFALSMVQLRMFATLQQLDLIPANRWFPSLLSFIPFTSESPMQWPQHSIGEVLWTVAPYAATFSWVSVHVIVSRMLDNRIYRLLPVSDTLIVIKRDDDDGIRDHRQATLNSLEGTDGQHASDNELAILSRLAEPTELTGSHQLVPILSTLPALLACDSLASWLTGIIVMPLEAFAMQVMARSYVRSAGLPPTHFSFSWHNFRHAVVAHSFQLVVTELIWISFVAVSHLWKGRGSFIERGLDLSVETSEEEDLAS